MGIIESYSLGMQMPNNIVMQELKRLKSRKSQGTVHIISQSCYDKSIGWAGGRSLKNVACF